MKRLLLVRWFIALSVLTSLATPAPVTAQARDPEWLRGLEELMQIEVTSASRREQKLADTAAAVFVLTRDDIRRSGLTTVPELLRLVPGVHVAQIDGNKWAVSVRGFNSRWANKLLVMIDGRSIYSRLFSGVFWDALTVPVSEIERIEVIRGPGGSLWGANAMNGVINIMTRKPKAREGAISATLGSPGTSSGSARYSSSLAPSFQYHAYIDAAQQGALDRGITHDQWRHVRFGGGAVADVSKRDQLRVESRVLDGTGWSLMDQSLTSLMPPRTNFLPGRSKSFEVSAGLTWTRSLAGAGALDMAFNVDHLDRDEGAIHDDARLIELTFQHTAPRRGRHEATWGLQAQHTQDEVIGTQTFHLIPTSATDSVFGMFGQDEMAFFADRLTLTFGAKVERFQSTGWHWQPTFRTRWRPTSAQTAWGAVSRAVRTPSLIDRGLRLQQLQGTVGGMRAIAEVSGNPNIPAESLQAYEAGYRWTTRRFSLDVAAYRNLYDGLGTIEAGLPRVQSNQAAPPTIIYPLVFDSEREATSNGAEVAATVTPGSWVRVTGSYTLFTLSSQLSAQSRETNIRFDADAPRHQGTLRWMLSLPHRFEVDSSVALLGELRRANVPAYALVDARVGWRSRASLDLSLVAQNLLDANHLQFQGRDTFVVSSVMRRRVWATAAWRF